MAKEEVIEKSDVKNSEKKSDGKKLVLYNDDVNSFQHVIECLVSICKLDFEYATTCAYIVHYRGKCCVQEGSDEKLKPMKDELLLMKLSAKIE